MDNHCVHKKLFVCSPLSGKRAPGGQCLRWNDLVSKDPKRYDLLEHVLCQASQDDEQWRRVLALTSLR